MRKTNPKILILGNFGYANHDLSGQTIKTRVSRELFEKYYPLNSVDYFDTQTLKNKCNIFKLLKKVINCDYLFYLPAHGNLKYLFPLYYILSKIFGFRIIYSVIGGWLVPYLKDKPIHRYMLKHIYVILAETSRMRDELEKDYDFKNVDVLYNFRMIEFSPEIKDHETLKLVFMARIDPNKGLDTIFNFCEYIYGLNPKPNISVDFYGPFSPNITEDEFMNQIDRFDFVHYHGALEPNNINKEICDYDLLMLPTHYFTEGLPGTIIDAFTSGLPAIVSEWRHAHEFIENGISGIIVPFDNNQIEFNDAIMRLLNNREMLRTLKVGAINVGKRFTDKYAWNKVSPYIK